MEFIKKKKRKTDTLAARLPGYKPLNVILRVVIISLIAVFMLHLIVHMISENIDKSDVHNIPARIYVIMILTFVISSEIQIGLDNILEKVFPVPNKVRLRFIIQIFAGFVVVLVASRLVIVFLEPDIFHDDARPGLYMGMLFGMFFVFLIANGLILARFTEKWSASQRIMSEMKREKLNMDYNTLQDQLNPHFLFNNLSVLKSLIIYDQNKAVTFTENFTDVYRYVLKSHENRLVGLRDELVFINSYIGLHKERLGEGLIVKFSLEKEESEMKIPPLTLQLLVENAIKHNIASADSPLRIDVVARNEYIEVINNFQPRESSYSTKTGLTNLMERYDMLTKKRIKIYSDSKIFKIEIPLLSNS